MKQLLLVIKREYSSRVKKPAFVLFTLITPLLLVTLALAPIFLNKSNFTKTTVKVFDETHIIGDIIAKHDQNKYLKYEVQSDTADIYYAQEHYDQDQKVMVLRIPENFVKNQSPTVELFNEKSPGIYVVSKIKNDLYDIRKKLLVYSTFKLDLQEFEQKMNSPVAVVFQGQGMNPQMQYFLGMAFTALLYLLIIIYGVQVMRGVLEEKSSRIVEIIVSSIQPATLLRGKILGIGLVGFTQFILVFILSAAGLFFVQHYFEMDQSDVIHQQIQMMTTQGQEATSGAPSAGLSLFSQQLLYYISTVIGELPMLFAILPLFFTLGYFLYASIFAAFGAAMNSESDIQHFVFPISVPLVISGFIAVMVLDNPNSEIAFWAAQFPLTSPIVMPARLAYLNFSSNAVEIASSILILASSVFLAMRFSGKIYKTGILLHGQKAGIRTIVKWLRK